MSEAILVYGDTLRSPDLRHQLPFEAIDSLLFVEHEGRRIAVANSVEQPLLEALDGLELMLFEELGRDQVAQALGSRVLADREVLCRALERIGALSARVSGDFPLALARALEDRGVQLHVDDELFVELRRRKSAPELEGIRRAQHAAERAVEAVRGALAAAATAGDGALDLEGAPLTVDGLKGLVQRRLAEHDATLGDFILSHGPQTAIGHEFGHGRLRAGESILLDLWPRDRRSGCWTDMTRTFCVGEPPPRLRELHDLCRRALAMLMERVRPGVGCADLHREVCELFEANGFRTPLSQPAGEVLRDGFPYGLGHGVGLELHEQPLLRAGETTTLGAGEVIAIEPALYVPGFGGCRIEDVVLVTDDGCEPLGTLGHELVVAAA